MVVDLNAIPKPGEYLVTSISELAIVATSDSVTLRIKRAEGSNPSNWKEL